MGRRKKRIGGPHGFVRLDKPVGPTSHYATRRALAVLAAGRAGHAGTLDPAASGLLVVLLGEATKLSAWVMDHDKVYLARVRLGVATETLDREGAVVAEAPVPAEVLRPERITEALAGFVGEVLQVPPRYSALKIAGKRAMYRARSGEELVLPPRPVVCHDLELRGVEERDVLLRIHCGKGYYVRSLARDLGEALGVPAHLAELRRTRSGPHSVEDAVAPDEVTPERVRPIRELVPDIPQQELDEEETEAARHGRLVPARCEGQRALLLDPAGGPVALAERAPEGRWRIVRGLRTS